MASLAAEKREREKAIRDLLKPLSQVNAVVESARRLVRRKLKRKRALPDERDLADIIKAITAIIGIINTFSKLPSLFESVWKI